MGLGFSYHFSGFLCVSFCVPQGYLGAVQEGPSGDCGGEEIGVLGFLNLK